MVSILIVLLIKSCTCCVLGTLFALIMYLQCLFVQFWTESFVQWSPLGTYLATVHRQGAQVWGGATTFDRLTRYAHPQVTFWLWLTANKRLPSIFRSDSSDCRLNWLTSLPVRNFLWLTAAMNQATLVILMYCYCSCYLIISLLYLSANVVNMNFLIRGSW